MILTLFVLVNYFTVVMIELELLESAGSRLSLLTLPVLKNLLLLDARGETEAVIVAVSFESTSVITPASFHLTACGKASPEPWIKADLM